jgi:Kelch motif protein/galactose oxidase-like protein
MRRPFRIVNRKWFAAAEAALATLVGASAMYAQGRWKELAPVSCPPPLLCPSEGMAVGGVGEVIVGAYGFARFSRTKGGDQTVTRLYHINRNSWSLGAPAPAPPRAEMAYGETTHGDTLYVIGGRSESCPRPEHACGNLERYKLANNTWATLTPMPTPRAAAAAAVKGDAIYVVGGRAGGDGPCSADALDVVERYDIHSDTWSTVAPLPSPRSDAAAVEHGGKVYVFGGCSFGVFLDEVLVYDPEADAWSSKTPMPTARASLVAGRLGDKVYAIGGWDGGLPLDANEVYNIASDSWSTAAPLPTARGEAGVYSHGDRLYVVGGTLFPLPPEFPFGDATDANEGFKAHGK